LFSIAREDNMEVEMINPTDYREITKELNAVNNTGEFKAYENVILISFVR